MQNEELKNQLLLELHRKIDLMMGVTSNENISNEEESIRQRIWANMEKRKYRALLKKNLKNKL